MGYEIDLIINDINDTSKCSNVITICEAHNCEHYYVSTEYDNQLKHKNLYTLINVTFNISVADLAYFLVQIKKIKKVQFQTIYDTSNNKLIYGSQYYLTNLSNKPFCNEDYKHRRSTRSYSENDVSILEIVCPRGIIFNDLKK
uniref:Uncharacterized protein n=1 Tax=viral metagenome TaxID=1070528 RepID=A0A6C0LMF8_9ZZZZ